jgi:putative peptidoglycan lipid II flippase
VTKLIIAGVVLGGALFAGSYGLERALSGMPAFREETTLALLLVLGSFIYGLAVLILLGRGWLRSLLRDVSAAADKPLPKLATPDPTDDSAALPDSEPPPTL